MGKLIFFDIDGTIAMPGTKPSAAAVHAIRAVRSNGHKVFLSTGRLETAIAEDIRSIGFDGGIYSAGGRVVVQGTEILNHPMPFELVQRVMGALQERNMFFFLECASGIYLCADVGAFSAAVYKMVSIFRKDLHAMSWAQKPENDPVYKIVFLAKNKKQAEQLARHLRPYARTICFATMIPNGLLASGEISCQDIDKGTALNHICRYLDVSPADCIAFGDSMNDAEILQAAGIGVAMGNAEACVKEIADQVCGRCEDDGLAKALADMGLI